MSTLTDPVRRFPQPPYLPGVMITVSVLWWGPVRCGSLPAHFFICEFCRDAGVSANTMQRRITRYRRGSSTRS